LDVFTRFDVSSSSHWQRRETCEFNENGRTSPPPTLEALHRDRDDGSHQCVQHDFDDAKSVSPNVSERVPGNKKQKRRKRRMRGFAMASLSILCSTFLTMRRSFFELDYVLTARTNTAMIYPTQPSRQTRV